MMEICCLSLFSMYFLVFMACSTPSEQDQTQPSPFNVVVLILDDLSATGFDTKSIKTPHFDALRKEAVYFPYANCPAPVCIPSRAGIFTGIAPHRSGVYLNGGDPWNDSQALKEAETLAELFKRTGYYTYGRGKIYHKNLEEGRIERNFDNRPIYEGGFGPFPDSNHRAFSKEDKFPKFWGVQAYPDSTFPDVINTDAVIEFLQQEHEKPFFVTLGLWRPHTPFTAPQRFFDLYERDSISIPDAYQADDLEDIPGYAQSLLDPFGRFEVAGAKEPEEWRRFIHGYYACTSFADWNTGRIIKAIEESQYANNTIFVLFTDNGFHLGTKDHWEKNTLWDASALSPLFIKFPGNKSDGKRVNTPVSLMDLYPTLVDYCGLKEQFQDLDGQSLRKYIDQPDLKADKPVITSFGEHFVSLRTEHFRYIQYPDGSEELYDVKADPYEWNNLAELSEYVKQLEELRKHIPGSFAKELPGRRN